MPTVNELTRPYTRFLLTPRPGPAVCAVCFNLTNGYRHCWSCAHGGHCLDAVLPISYSVSGGRLHEALAGYKRRDGSLARQLAAELAAVLWRFLALHERCVADAAAIDGFDLISTVPSSDVGRDERHPLHRLVGELVGPARGRHRRLLRRTGTPSHPREFDIHRFESRAALDGRSVLLVDDTWTTGANAQSAAAALKAAGAGAVGAVVIGRYLNWGWQQNGSRLEALPRPFRWEQCALDAEGQLGDEAEGARRHPPE